jgi:hypothetical protein
MVLRAFGWAVFSFLAISPLKASDNCQIMDDLGEYCSTPFANFKAAVKQYKGPGSVYDIKGKGRYKVTQNKAEITPPVQEKTNVLGECLKILRSIDENDRYQVNFDVLEETPLHQLVIQVSSAGRNASLFLTLQPKQ